jgi:hypothetical protein
MTAKTTDKPPTGLELLRQPFPAHQISKLPKETKAQIDQRKADRNYMVFNCPICGGHHHKNAVHLDYVGHAALTDRLLDCDPHWDWEPYTAPGLPNPGNGMWIKLTVCGQSRIGYGHADGKTGGDAIKEIVGDALRNAAMRFGAALDLWHKGDLHLEEAPEPPAIISDADCVLIMQLIEATGTDARKFCQAFKIASVKELPAEAFPKAKAMLDRKLADAAQAAKPEPTLADEIGDDIPY